MSLSPPVSLFNTLFHVNNQLDIGYSNSGLQWYTAGFRWTGTFSEKYYLNWLTTYQTNIYTNSLAFSCFIDNENSTVVLIMTFAWHMWTFWYTWIRHDS